MFSERMKGKKMKKILLFFLAALFLAFPLASCSRPPEINEIRDRLGELVEKSQTVNMIFFGRYFETYERIYDPKENLKLYKDPTTKKEYYY